MLSRIQIEGVNQGTPTDDLLIDEDRRARFVGQELHLPDVRGCFREQRLRLGEWRVRFAYFPDSIADPPREVLGRVTVLAETHLGAAEIHGDLPSLDERPCCDERRFGFAVLAALAVLNRFVVEVARLLTFGFADMSRREARLGLSGARVWH